MQLWIRRVSETLSSSTGTRISLIDCLRLITKGPASSAFARCIAPWFSAWIKSSQLIQHVEVSNFASESQRLGSRIGLGNRRNGHPGARPQQLQGHSE